MSAYFQTEIQHRGDPVASIALAARILDDLGIQFEGIEAEDPDNGIWMVAFTGQHGRDANAGRDISEAGQIGGDDREEVADVEVYVPQP